MLLNPHWSQPLNMPSRGFTFKSMDFTTRKKKKIPFPILLWIAPHPPISILNNFLSPGGFHCALLGSFSALIMNPSICLYKARLRWTGLVVSDRRGVPTVVSFRFIFAVNGRFLRFWWVLIMWPLNAFWATNCSYNLSQITPAAPRATPPLHLLYGHPPPLLQLPGASRDSGSVHVSRNATYMCLVCRGVAGRRWLQGKSLVV